MKVLFIAHCRCMYGANKSLLNLILDLRTRYHVEPVVLLPIERDGDFAEILKCNGIPCYIHVFYRWIEAVGRGQRGIRAVYKAVRNHGVYRNLYQLLKDEKIDMVHSNSSTIQVGAWLADKLKVPHIWHVREFGEEDYQVEIIYPTSVRNCLFSKAYRVIAISQAIADKYHNMLSNGNNINVVYNGIDNPFPIREIKEIENGDNNNEKKVHFVCAGVLSELKGQFTILNACEILQRQGIKGYQVHLIGNGATSYETMLKDYVTEHNLNDFVIFHGYREDVPDMLQQMDVGIVASEKEAFGRVTVEYMFATLPVIGADSGGTKELINDGKNGKLYTAGDPQGLADCMKTFIAQPSIIGQMGQTAYQIAEDKFSLRANTDQIYQIYEESLGKIR
ncbi:MAG: glycosyltransferase family 4 protein [Lachnospiraceae bacterium]|nr:glycosyltransferase family 4 protein [Lachnospiraceae bacterium]